MTTPHEPAEGPSIEMLDARARASRDGLALKKAAEIARLVADQSRQMPMTTELIARTAALAMAEELGSYHDGEAAEL